VHADLDHRLTRILHGSDTTLVDVDCNEVLKHTLFVCQARMQESRAMVTDGRLPMVRADARQLAQVLQNVVSNAIKYRCPVTISRRKRLRER
jgi:light-regulated signal transduction histidine kinase (bacteriophytochrome)